LFVYWIRFKKIKAIRLEYVSIRLTPTLLMWSIQMVTVSYAEVSALLRLSVTSTSIRTEVGFRSAVILYLWARSRTLFTANGTVFAIIDGPSVSSSTQWPGHVLLRHSPVKLMKTTWEETVSRVAKMAPNALIWDTLLTIRTVAETCIWLPEKMNHFVVSTVCLCVRWFLISTYSQHYYYWVNCFQTLIANQYKIRIISSSGQGSTWGKLEIQFVGKDGTNETFMLTNESDEIKDVGLIQVWKLIL